MSQNDSSLSPEAQRKRQERERKRAAGMKEKTVTLSPYYQQMSDEILAYTGHKDFQALIIDLLKGYYIKVSAHKNKHERCGKCGDPYVKDGSCVFEGEQACQYSRNSQRNKELKP